MFHLFNGSNASGTKEHDEVEEEQEEEVSIGVSYLELYNENVRDLLVDSERNLEVSHGLMCVLL